MKKTSALPRRLASHSLFLLLAALAGDALGFSNSPGSLAGTTNRNNPSPSCGQCHGAVSGTTVVISGASALIAGQSSTYTITATKSPIANGTKMGLVVAASDGGTPLSVVGGMPTGLQGNEIIHATSAGALRTTTANSATYTVTYTMPIGAAAGSTHTLYAVAALSFSGWNHATNFVVTTRPTATTGLTASNPTASSIDLSWTGGGPEYRVVYRAGGVVPVNETDGLAIDVGAVTSTTVGSLNASTKYSFAVFSKLTGQSIFATSGSTATASTTAVITATRYVNAATGVDSGACKLAGSPCKTITFAMNQAVAGDPGDLVSVAPGTYNLALGEVFPIALKSGVRLEASGPDAIVDATGPALAVNGGILTLTGNASSFTRVEGMTFINGLVTPGQGGVGLGGAMYISGGGANLVTITRNVFRANTARGYSADGSLGHAGGLAWGGAIAVFGATVDIINNVFIANTARGGAGLDHFGSGLTGHENGGEGQGGAIYFAGSGRVINNTFSGNVAVGGNGGGSSTGTGQSGGGTGGAIAVNSNPAPEITNNIFQGNSASNGTGGQSRPSTAGAVSSSLSVVTKNLHLGNLVNGGASTGDNLGTGSIEGNPLFHGTAIFALRNSSPAKGAGTAIGAPTIDFNGTARTNPPSIGAYEAYFIAQAITFGTAPSIVVPGTGSASATGGASGNPVTFTSQTPGVCTVSGSTVTGVSGGTCTIAANQAGNTDYTAAPQVTQSFSIATTSFTLTVTRNGTGGGTVTSSPAGINCGSTCAASFASGAGVTLTASAAVGSTFAGWSGGGCGGTGGCSVTMNGAAGVTATFDISQTPTTFNVLINGAQEVPPNAVGGSGSGTATVDPAANTMTYSFTLTGLSGPIVSAHFHGPAARGVDGNVKIDITGSPFSGTVGYNQADEADILNGLWYVNFHTSAFPGGELRGQLDGLGGPATFALSVNKAGMGTGTVTSSPAGINCGATCLANMASGSTVTLTATAAAGSVFGGWSGGGCSGTGTCVVTMSAAAGVTATFSSPPRLGNISTRGIVLTGNDVMIGGFIVGGSTPKTVIIRANGPSLTAQGVPGALANPMLQLFSGQTLLAVNDNWQQAPNAATIQSSAFVPLHPLDSAIYTTLAPGAYTAIVAGSGGGTGVGLVEIFEVDHPETPLVNISTRGQVQTGSNVMIAGFVIQGSGLQTVIVRARGPSMAAQGLAGALANPILQLFTGQTQMAVNDNWQQTPNAAAIQSSGFAPSDPLESAILMTLAPGAYTAIVTGFGNTSGVGIVEVFTVP